MRLPRLFKSILPQRPALHMAADGVMVSKPAGQAASHTPVVSRSSSVGALDIPCPDPSDEDVFRDQCQSQATRLMRQEDWERLCLWMGEADAARAKTPGGMPLVDLIAYGARADVVNAVEHALLDGTPDPEAPVLLGIEAFETELSERPDCMWSAIIVAMTHMDMGWAWRGSAWEAETDPAHLEAFSAHFDRAAAILAPFDPLNSDSVALAQAHAMLSAGHFPSQDRIERAYEHLLDLDPANAQAMRAYGNQMLPRWHGTPQALELAARRVAARTSSHWGAGGYAWVMFDAIVADNEACANLDYDFFVEGLRDILHLRRDQSCVNLLAAYCSNTMISVPMGDPDADHMRIRVAGNAKWMVREYLREVHAATWAHAARGFDNALRVRCPLRFARAGLADAERVLKQIFRNELAAGLRVRFTEAGIVTEPNTSSAA